MDTDLETYLKRFGTLRVDRNRDRYTCGRAPHKPTLLLCLILLHLNRRIDLRNIDLNQSALMETWAQLWEGLEYPRPGPINLPLYHLRSDGFWHIRFREGVHPAQPGSLSRLRDMVASISMDERLVRFIEDDNSRDRLINALLNGGYYSDREVNRLRRNISDLGESFVYEERITDLVRYEFRMDPLRSLDGIGVPTAGAVRDSAFRRLVLDAYSRTCSFCGLRLETSRGRSVIDAAHILPFSVFRNDDIRNGLALCKTHHWLFDGGVLSVDDRYRITVSSSIDLEHPEGIITGLNGRDLALPRDAEKYPHPSALEWHRTRHGHGW